MEQNVLKVMPRDEVGRSLNKMRKQGWIPCVMYGAKSGSVPLKVSNMDVVRFLHSLSSEHALIKLELNKTQEDVLLKDIQYHPFRHEILHIDFHKVAMDEAIETTVIVEEVGTAKGLAHGGLLEHNMRELTIECLPKDIPSVIEVDVSHLEIGDTIYVQDIVAPEGVKILDDPNLPVLSLAAPRVEVEEVPAEEGVAEPELIRRREKEEVEE